MAFHDEVSVFHSGGLLLLLAWFRCIYPYNAAWIKLKGRLYQIQEVHTITYIE